MSNKLDFLKNLNNSILNDVVIIEHKRDRGMFAFLMSEYCIPIYNTNVTKSEWLDFIDYVENNKEHTIEIISPQLSNLTLIIENGYVIFKQQIKWYEFKFDIGDYLYIKVPITNCIDAFKEVIEYFYL